MLMLDAAYPPSPDQLVADLDQAGADAAAVYVWGPIARWTVAHVVALRARGKYLLPIVVPGDSPVSPRVTLAAAHNLGFPDGPIVVDVERFSMPPATWVADWAREAAAWGLRPFRYGSAEPLAAYLPMDGDWVAYYPRARSLQPVPGFPGDLVAALRRLQLPVPVGPIVAWQYTNDVNLAHGNYDVSIVTPALFAAAAPAPAAGAGEGTMLRIPGPVPDSFHLFATHAGHLVRASTVAGGLGGLEHWLSSPGAGWVDHGAPADHQVVAGTLAGGRGVDGLGSARVEVHCQVADGSSWSIGFADDGTVVLPWRGLTTSGALDMGAAGPPGPDVRPAVAEALDAAAAKLRG